MFKKIIITVLLLFYSAFSSNISGEYVGKIENMNSTLILYQTNNFINGELITQGYHYNIQGRIINNNKIKGIINDRITKIKIEFKGSLKGKYLYFNFGNKKFVLKKIKNIQPIKTKIQKIIDKNLIGKWIRAEIVAGEKEEILKLPIVIKLEKNGNFQFLDKYITRTGEIRTIFSKKGNNYVGKWQAIDNILYIRTSEGYKWEPVGKYKIIKNKLFLTLPDATLETWIRK